MSRTGYLILGWISLSLGVIGVFLPLMPTTVFMLIAAWAFSHSSERWHNWLLTHRRFGPLIHAWQQHHAMPRRAKRYALLTLAASYAFTASVFGPLSLAAIIGGVCVAAVALYIAHIPVLTREQEQAQLSDNAGG